MDSPTGDDKIRHGENLIAQKGLLLMTLNVMLVTNSDLQRQKAKLPSWERTTSLGRLVNSDAFFLNFDPVEWLHSFAQSDKIQKLFLAHFF